MSEGPSCPTLSAALAPFEASATESSPGMATRKRFMYANDAMVEGWFNPRSFSTAR